MTIFCLLHEEKFKLRTEIFLNNNNNNKCIILYKLFIFLQKFNCFNKEKFNFLLKNNLPFN